VLVAASFFLEPLFSERIFTGLFAFSTELRFQLLFNSPLILQQQQIFNSQLFPIISLFSDFEQILHLYTFLINLHIISEQHNFFFSSTFLSHKHFSISSVLIQ
jgi:hypothetical protein